MVTFSIDVLASSQDKGLEESLGEMESLLHLERFLRSPGVRGTRLAGELATYLPSDGAYLRFSWRELAGRLLDFLAGRTLETIDEWESAVPISLLHLYCPSIIGTRASLRIGEDRKEQSSCKLRIFGMGGGNDFTFELVTSDTLSTEGESQVVVVSYLSKWRLIRSTGAAGDAYEYPRLDGVDAGNQEISVHTIASPELNPLWGNQTETTVFDLTQTEARWKRSLTTGSGNKWHGSAQVKIPKTGVDFGTEYAVTSRSAFTYEYDLPPGHRYCGRRFENAPHWWWW